MRRNVKDGVVNDYQLALVSRAVFDIGPRTRVVILMFGMIGIAMAFMASLVSHKQVPLDKIIHFSGYFILSATFVLALRPVFFISGLIGLIGMSAGGSELPISLVLSGMSEKIRLLADQLTKSGRGISADSTMA